MATLTATANVNLTTATGWSPAQIPANGDDLIVPFWLTLDADKNFNSITFNNINSRMIISGTSRTVTATTWNITAAITGRLVSATIGNGITISLFGKWIFTTGGATSAGLFSLTGSSTLNFSTIGGVASDVLFECVTASHLNIVVGTLGTLNTTGRILLANATGTSATPGPVSGSGITWNHVSSGNNTFGGGMWMEISGAGRLNWTGDVINYTSSVAITGAATSLFRISGSGTSIITGNMSIGTITTGNSDSIVGLIRVSDFSGVLTLIGNFVSTGRGYSLVTASTSSGIIRYKDQTITVGSTEIVRFRIGSNTLDLTNLVLNNSGRISIETFGNGQLSSDTNLTVNNIISSAQAVIVDSSDFVSSKVIITNTPPVFPDSDNVAAGEEYGWVGSFITGTGLVIDPVILEDAIDNALVPITTEVGKIIKSGESFTASDIDTSKVVAFTRNV